MDLAGGARGGDAAEGGLVGEAAGETEVGAVEDVEGLGAEVEVGFFGQVDFAG